MKPKSARGSVPTTIDEYLAPLNADKRSALQTLRKDIHAAAPGLVECISYGLGAFRLNGKTLVYLGAAAGHCAFYPGSIVQAFKDELKAYDTSKGTIRFQPSDPQRSALVRKIVKARIAQNAQRAKKA